jgi:hypothetical protein
MDIWSSRITDQPGRILAVLVFAPLIVYKGIKYRDWFLLAFGILLFAWDLFWLLCRPPRAVQPVSSREPR